VSYVYDIVGLTLVRACNHHHALDESCFFVFIKIYILLFQSVDCIVDNTNCSVHDKFTGINLGLGLLDLK